MNEAKLKTAAKTFLEKYPGGFANPYFEDIEKKHRMSQMVELTQSSFYPSEFTDNSKIIESLNKIVSRSSMVSMFEKPKFRDFTKSTYPATKDRLADGLKEMLHGNQEAGFEMMLDVLSEAKLAKWSLITVAPAYFRPLEEVFIKPTTAKGIISFLELENLEYKPRPSWSFYQEYRKQINEMKSYVDESLYPSNPAFSGFLMMVMEQT